MNDERDPSSPDPLDGWLSEARWPEPTRISTERLRAQWKEITAPRKSPLLPRVLAVAAAIAIVAVGILWSLRSETIPMDQPVAAAPIRLPGREMTGLERTLVAAQERKELLKKKQRVTTTVSEAAPGRSEGVYVKYLSVPASSTKQSFPVRPFLDRVANVETRAEALESLDKIHNPPTDELLEYLTGSRGDLRVPAALALGRIDGPVTTRRLIRMIEQNQSRREAFIALASSRGRDAQRYVQAAAESERYAGIAKSAMIASQAELQ